MLLLVSCSERAAIVEALPCVASDGTRSFITPNGELINPKLVEDVNISPLVNGFFTASTPEGRAVYKLNGDKVEAIEGLSGLKSAGYMACGVMPVCRSGNHVELVNPDGERVATLELKEGEITECAPCFVDGVLVITNDKGRQGLVDTEGRVLIEPIYSSISPIRDGLMIAMIESNKGAFVTQSYVVVNTSGKVVFDLKNDVPVCDIVCNGKVVVKTKNGFAVVDINSGVAKVLPESVSRVQSVADGLIVYRNKTGDYGLLSVGGEAVLDAVYNGLRIGKENVVAAHKGNWQIIDTKTDVAIDLPELEMLSPVTGEAQKSGFAFVGKTAQGYYLIDNNGKHINESPLKSIDYGKLSMTYMATDYPVSTAPIEMPGDYTDDNE